MTFTLLPITVYMLEIRLFHLTHATHNDNMSINSYIQVVYWEVSRLSVYRDGTNTILEEVTSDVLTAVEGGEDGAG